MGANVDNKRYGRLELQEIQFTHQSIAGRFCMVARDAKTQKAKAVNPLILETPEDRTLFNIG